MTSSHLLTATTAARALGVSAGRVRQLIAAGRLPAVKHGRDWLILEADLARVAVRKPGRPVTTGTGLRLEPLYQALLAQIAPGRPVTTGTGLRRRDRQKLHPSRQAHPPRRSADY